MTDKITEAARELADKISGNVKWSSAGVWVFDVYETKVQLIEALSDYEARGYQRGLKDKVLPDGFPAGAIHNGRMFYEHGDYEEFNRCFEFIATYLDQPLLTRQQVRDEALEEAAKISEEYHAYTRTENNDDTDD